MRYRLAIGAAVRAEGRYLREWVAYHRAVGVEHFFLLDDNTDERARAADLAALRPFARHVTVERFVPDRCLQAEGFTRLLAGPGRDCDWMALVDADEFLVPVGGDSVPGVLADFERPGVAALAVNWLVFGGGGRVRPPELQTRDLVRCARPGHRVNTTVKCVARPAYCAGAVPHLAVPVPGWRVVNQAGREVTGKHAAPAPGARLRVNHYVVRSLADWQRKMVRGWRVDRATGERWTIPQWVKRFGELDRNEAKDREIQRHLPAVLAALAEAEQGDREGGP